MSRPPHAVLWGVQSFAGTAACFSGGFLAGLSFLQYLQACGVLHREVRRWEAVTGSALAALLGALVESLPIAEVDNLTVPFAVVLSARLFFGF
jgi:dolichol kinase